MGARVPLRQKEALSLCAPDTTVAWLSTSDPVDYLAGVTQMEALARDIRAGTAPELVWLLEHPPLYTAGTSARPTDLLTPRFPVYPTGRGGQYTYHGPGQRVAYVMLDLKRRKPDVRWYVCQLESWLIATLAEFGVRGERREGRVGIWVAADGTEKKIAAVGVRVRQWVTFHGVALNVCPDLSHFSGIVPCGLKTFGVTSLADLGVKASMENVDAALQETFSRFFQP
jgi:lipoyl(octanoyl) transferase